MTQIGRISVSRNILFLYTVYCSLAMPEYIQSFKIKFIFFPFKFQKSQNWLLYILKSKQYKIYNKIFDPCFVLPCLHHLFRSSFIYLGVCVFVCCMCACVCVFLKSFSMHLQTCICGMLEELLLYYAERVTFFFHLMTYHRYLSTLVFYYLRCFESLGFISYKKVSAQDLPNCITFQEESLYL